MFRLILLAVAFCFVFTVSSRAALLLQPNDRLALCGDGMTSDLGYTVYTVDYLLGCQQVPGLVPAEFGWSAQTPDAFVGRIDTDLAPFKPTVATICYNFFGNPTDTNALEGRRKGETDLIEALKKMGVRTIVLGSPPYGSDAQAPVAAVDQDVATKEGVVYADVFGATKAAIDKAHAKLGPSFAVDGDGMALAISYAFLKALGCDGDIGRITVDFTPEFHIGKADGSPGHTVQSFDDQTLKATSSRFAFFFPGYPNGKPLPEPFEACVPFDAELNRFVLVVKDLPSPAAKVYWNGDWHDYSAEDLAKGVNLTEGIPDMFANFQNLDNGVRNIMQDQRIMGSAKVQGTQPDPRVAATVDSDLQTAMSRIVPQSYTIRIQPLAAPEKQPSGPVNVIFDTDMDGDYDDAVALSLLNDFMCQGECKILACNVNTHNTEKTSGATVQAIDAYYGHPDIPIGACYGADEPLSGSGYTTQIKNQFTPNFPPDDKLPKGVDVYRKALAGAPDNSVVICSVGSMGNITDLLKSAPDDASPLAGPDLVKQKVRKLVIMANTNKNDVFVIKNWPTPILWSTDIGNYIYPGKSVMTTPLTNPLHVIFNILHVDSRQGWDPTAVWLAVRGTSDGVYEVATGGYWRVNVPPLEWGTWINGPVTNHGMATVKMPSDQVLKLFNDELARPPK